jgi:hypothetical protein
MRCKQPPTVNAFNGKRFENARTKELKTLDKDV